MPTPSRRKIAGVLLLMASIGLLGAAGWFGAYPVYTNMQAAGAQASLKETFVTPEFRQTWGRTIKEGSPVTQLVIPKIGTDTVVLEGISPKALNAGAGHYPMTPLPGKAGNVGIAGHRTMYGKPFNRIDELREGDVIFLRTPFEKFTYKVTGEFDGHTNPYIVPNNSWSVISPTQEAVLTLTACHPKGSARQRIVVRARLVEEDAIA